MSALTTHVATVTTALHAISNHLGTFITDDDTTPEQYATLEDDLINLENAINHHATIAAQAAALAERTNAAHTIGSTHLIDYLTTTFGLSKARAHHRITLAHSLYPKPTTPSPGSNGDKSNGGPDGSSNDDDSGDDDPDPEPEAEPGQEPASGSEPGTSGGAGTPEPTHPGGTHISAEKHAIITDELTHLNPNTTPSYKDLRDQALGQAIWRTPEDLRTWLRHQITTANTVYPNPITAMGKRYLALSKPDANNMVRIHGLIPASTAALITANTAPLTKRGDLVDIPASDDTRNRGQRYADALHHIMDTYNHGIVTPARGGTASIIISMTTDDIDDINHSDASPLNTLYPTNTGYSLNLAEIMNLIAAKYDFAVLLDGATGQPLNVHRMQRNANLTQRIAVFASELVCSAPNCDRPQLECEIHHLDPWIRGGLTNLVNLTQQCFNHHPRNDDTRSGVNGKGFMDRDPVTGRVGHYPPGGDNGPVFNRSAAADASGGAWARRKHRATGPPGGQQPPDPPGPYPNDGGLFHRPAS
ncbi:HNH endonuclease signature motif containing protein [Corynebacterium crudilactis]|uniref:DUF222 domain-containing protein n=1 Tax=Corynebacterium crudilactis TaxID=1652495 RepID=A0A172QUX5_9CORY|nr:HNH endonuclease signature motif containing protein [Corynebacterium crudilactis]ANE04509.1 hypothetical protein ccrud_10060 [Corynebacterium crudilactis]